MKNIFSVIFMNFWGYDLIIFLAAAFTGFVFYSTKKSADRLHKKMNLTLYAPDSNAWREAEEEITGLRESDVIAMRNHTSKLYSLFVNLTGIFPLLGILGTVISLLGLVSDMQDVTGNFYGALTYGGSKLNLVGAPTQLISVIIGTVVFFIAISVVLERLGGGLRARKNVINREDAEKAPAGGPQKESSKEGDAQ